MKFITLVVCLLLLAGCASAPQLKYEKQTFTPPPKSEEYKLPTIDFGDPPKPIFLAKQSDGNWKEVAKEQGELIAYTSKEHDKIVVRIQYYKEMTPKLVDLVNIHIKRDNLLIDLVVDQQTAKEIYRELLVDVQNQAKSDKNWNTAEKGGLWAIIIGQLIAIFSLAL